MFNLSVFFNVNKSVFNLFKLVTLANDIVILAFDHQFCTKKQVEVMCYLMLAGHLSKR